MTRVTDRVLNRVGYPKLTLIALVLLGALLVLGLSSCGDKFNQPYQDASRSGVKNTAPADVIEMPDGFSNLTTKCDHGNRVYVAYHANSSYAAVGVVAHDPTC